KVIETIIEKRKDLTNEMFAYLNERLSKLDEIVLVGSGTSNTSAQTSYEFIEEVSGLSTSSILPNIFLLKHVYNPNALYIFTSQSGTSTLIQEAQNKIKKLGYATIALSETADSPLAKLVVHM
ncbi:MAG: sugar isomerase, partial [Longicatena sp.]